MEETLVPASTGRKNDLAKMVVTIVVVLVLVAGSAGSAYWWRGRSALSYEKKQAADIASLRKDKANLTTELAAAKGAANATAACTAKAPDASTVENIEASITSANTAALQGYMASSVADVYAASDAIPPKAPADSVSDISSFVTDQITGVWSFPVDAGTVATYRQGSYGQYFPSIAVVGSSTRHRVISFAFDCSGKINTVFMAADDAVL